jgi:hypothetical protein
MRLFKDTKGIRSYASEANAEKAADKFAALVESGHKLSMRYVLIPADGGRYAVVFILNNTSMYLAGSIANAGFCVAG